MHLVAPALLAAVLPGQELLWEEYSTSGIMNISCLPEWGDYNHDGATDLLIFARDTSLPFPLIRWRVLSGVDGSSLAESQTSYGSLQCLERAGDLDGDGFDDVMYFRGGGGSWLEVWSIVRDQVLLAVPAVGGPGVGDAICGDVDTDGDGWPELVWKNASNITVTDRFGQARYVIPSYAMGLDVQDLQGVGDIDQDGCDDFVAGGSEFFSGVALGAVALFSGRTGQLLRVHFGPQPFAVLGKELRQAGDVDGDGVPDYAAGNLDGFFGLMMVWSGATGALLRQWSVPLQYLYGTFLAGMDVDLDGLPDVINVASGYPNVPGLPAGWWGRVRTLSMRDGQDLVHVASQQYTSYFGGPGAYADLGVQPGNPYPVFVVMDELPLTGVPTGFARIRAYRCSPPGTRFVGTGCASVGPPPTIGIRRVDASPTDHSRLVLGSAPPNAFAVLVAAPTSTSLPGPVPLDFLGLPGCDLLVAPVITELRLTGATGIARGHAAVDVPSPMLPGGGSEFAAQWVVLDPVTLRYAATARYEFRVQ